MKTKQIVVSAMMIAVGTLLSLFQPFSLPFGGGITIASMMPIVIIAYCYGTKKGLLCAFVFSLLQMLLGMKTVTAFFLPGDSQMVLWKAITVCLLDYVLAYTVLGFGGVFKEKINNTVVAICLGTVLALGLRYIVHIISGTVFFGEWAEWFFTQEGFYKIGEKIMSTFSGNSLAFVYSVFYNGLYMIPEIIITTIVTPIVYKALSASKLV